MTWTHYNSYNFVGSYMNFRINVKTRLSNTTQMQVNTVIISVINYAIAWVKRSYNPFLKDLQILVLFHASGPSLSCSIILICLTA